MKNNTLWVFVLFTCWQISAQTGTVIVGVSDGTPNTSYGNPSPMQDFYKTQRIQILYTASELTGVGLVAGNITQIGWVATDLNLSTLQENYSISLKSTNLAALTFSFETGATLVYGPTDFTPSATGNVMFTLTTPFAWDGTSNIIVEVCAGTAAGEWSENVSCANSTTTAIQTVFYKHSLSSSPCIEATGITTNQRPLLVVTGNVASCLAPLNVVSANITAFTADLSWDVTSSTSGIGYEYVISTTNTTPTTTGIATTNIYASLSSLLPQTTYYIFVRANCGAGQFSGWNGTSSFTTTCASVTSFSQNFDALTAPAFPICWGRVGTGGSTAIDNFNASSAPNALYMESWSTTNLAVVKMQPVSNLGAGTHRLKLKIRGSWSTGGIVEFGYLTNPMDITTFVALTAMTAATLAYESVIFAPPVGTYSDYPAFKHTGNPTNKLLIDDVVWEAIPSCPDPTVLVSANATTSSVDVSWDPATPVPSSGYEYFVSTTTTLPTTAGTATTNTFAVLTGLAPATTYYLFVRSNCGSGSFSPWSTSISFTTACASVTSFTQNFDAVISPAFPSCWDKLGISGSVFVDNFNPSSPPNVISFMESWSTIDSGVLKMQPVSNLGTGTHRLKFKMCANYTVGDSVEFGYLTNPMYASTFVPLTTMTAASLAYQNFTYSPTAGTYSGYPAFRHAGNSLLIDDIVWEAIPSCVEPTALVYTNITSSGVNVSWTAPVTAPANGYEYVVSTSNILPTIAGTAVTTTFATVSGLTPATTYYIFVRAICSTSDASPWVGPISFLSACVPITTLPWSEGFEGLTTVGATKFPPCWFKENGDWSSRNTNDTYSSSNTGTNFIRDAFGAINEYIWTPGFQLTAGTSYDFSSFIQGDNGTTWVVSYFVNTNQVSTGATQLGTSYNIPGTGPSYTAQPYTKITHSFVPTTSGVYYFAVRVNEPTYFPMYVTFDDFELKVTPNFVPSCATGLTSVSNATCGNYANQLSWNAVSDATSYYVTIGTTSGGTDIANAVSVIATNYSFLGDMNTQYFWKVVPYSGAGPAIGCAEQSFTTVVTGCYCSSVPTSNDGLGITNAIVDTTPFVITDVTYVNNTATAIAVEPGTNTNVQLTFVTWITYDINIWIDFNNDFDFNDAGELVKTGIACTNSINPNTVDASFLMPVTAPTGAHRMRIGTADLGQATPAPCYSGSYGVTLDFTVDTTLGSNSFDTSNFVAYPNPVKEVLNLSYKTAISNVKVINLLGQEVVNAKANTNDVQVDMSALNAGVYIVNLTVDDTVHTIKVIKE